MSRERITPRKIIQTKKSLDQRDYLIEEYIEKSEQKLEEPMDLVIIQSEKEKIESMKKKPN